jgi:predicted RNase H-like nuclease (RuvC/YqgF family)
MPDDSEEARWKARYRRIEEAHQAQHSAIARLEVRVEALEKALAARSAEVVQMERSAAKVDREETRKRRFQERMEATKAALEVRIANAQSIASELAKRGGNE